MACYKELRKTRHNAKVNLLITTLSVTKFIRNNDAYHLNTFWALDFSQVILVASVVNRILQHLNWLFLNITIRV